ncbi:MAG: IS91 family transposase [Caulobacteraceae bacterium]|nr:IS91 family transposase [Caulobacteraceae bacterium]
MPRSDLEVADIFRALGPTYRARKAGHLSLGQLRVMSAIETCRTATLGGHVSRCEDCAHIDVAYNSCRNRHCPKCQAAAAYDWLEARRAELLPVAYYHVVFTLPAPIADIAYANKAVIYNALFKAASEALLTIAADPKHLGAKIGVTMVLHTWGSALTHHPHVHCIIPGGGVAPDGERWIPCRHNFFLPVRVLSRLFRRLMLQRLVAAHVDGALRFFGDHANLSNIDAFRAFLKPLHRNDWVVYAKRPFAGPDQVLSYLARYTHRVAIANSRLVAFEAGRVTFKWKDYRREGQDRYGLITLDGDDFIRRFLLHVLPDGFHRIRHYGLFANTARADNLALARHLLDAAPPAPSPTEPEAAPAPKPCPCCGGRLILIEAFERGSAPQRRAASPLWCDTS